MKKLIKVGAIVLAAALLISAGVMAAGSKNTWTATATANFQVESAFAEVSNISMAIGDVNDLKVFTADTTVTAKTLANFLTYNNTTSRPLTLAEFGTKNLAANFTYFEQTPIIKFSFTVTSRGDKSTTVAVTVPANANGVVITGGVAGTHGMAKVNTKTGLLNNQSVTFNYFLSLEMFKTTFSGKAFAFTIKISV